jgi:hypothetical protein
MGDPDKLILTGGNRGNGEPAFAGEKNSLLRDLRFLL